jgi:hypothetical protein
MSKEQIQEKLTEVLKQVNELADAVDALPDDADKPMDAYILLKDMPRLDAGTVFVHDKDDHEKGSIGCGCLKNAWDNGNCQHGKSGQNAWCAGTHILPGQLAEDRDWFEPFDNDGRYYAK